MDGMEGVDSSNRSVRVNSSQRNNIEKENRLDSDKIEENLENELDKNDLSPEEMREELEDEIEDMNNIMEPLEKDLTFSLHDETEKLMVEIIDIETDEVLKQMPPEEMLDLSAKIQRMVGILIDEKV